MLFFEDVDSTLIFYILQISEIYLRFEWGNVGHFSFVY